MSNMVGIIGISEMKCEGMNRKDSLTDLIFETTSTALKNAGITRAPVRVPSSKIKSMENR